MTVKCVKCEKDFEVVESFSNEETIIICPHCDCENRLETLYSQSMKKEDVTKNNDSPSFGIKIYDYIIASISFLDGIYKIIKAIYIGHNLYWFITSEGLWTFFPFVIGFGLLQHKKVWRIIGTILLIISLLLPYLL